MAQLRQAQQQTNQQMRATGIDRQTTYERTVKQMRSRILAVALTGLCLLIVASPDAAAKVAGEKSAVGTWRLEVSRSSFGNLPAPKFEQLVVSTDKPDMLKWNLKRITADGKSYIASYDGPIDGNDHPMMSSEAGSTVAYTRTAGGSVQWTVKDRTGAVIETGSGQLSPDGNTLTLRGTAQGPNGTSNFVSVFVRAQ
ncbi:MAG TPA: hypothetical protein VL240_01655 [Candidatus Binatia bacterium]|nr:hypothetical protein [Candidatus Binatia bacterium]